MILKSCQLHYQYFLASIDYPVPHGDQSLVDLVAEIRKQIYKICRQYNHEKANGIYENLFNSLKNVGSSRINANGNLESFRYPVNYGIFTTNYDLLFSKYLEYHQKNYADGFSGADIEGIE
jgi:hypothetical protein